ncbi:MAG TPA: hypothetical protein VHN82_01920 [Methanoregula sp.]|nr:hypothetical protein [Methanoregula sp.]
MKRQATGSVMLAEPRWFYDGETKTMVINLVNLTSKDLMAREGIGTVQMALGETRFDDRIPLNDVYLDYTYDPGRDYSTAWDNYFQKTLGMTREAAPEPLRTYKFPPTSRLVIKQNEVIIRSL